MLAEGTTNHGSVAGSGKDRYLPAEDRAPAATHSAETARQETVSIQNNNSTKVQHLPDADLADYTATQTPPTTPSSRGSSGGGGSTGTTTGNNNNGYTATSSKNNGYTAPQQTRGSFTGTATTQALSDALSSAAFTPSPTRGNLPESATATTYQITTTTTKTTRRTPAEGSKHAVEVVVTDAPAQQQAQAVHQADNGGGGQQQAAAINNNPNDDVPVTVAMDANSNVVGLTGRGGGGASNFLEQQIFSYLLQKLPSLPGGSQMLNALLNASRLTDAFYTQLFEDLMGVLSPLTKKFGAQGEAIVADALQTLMNLPAATLNKMAAQAKGGTTAGTGFTTAGGFGRTGTTGGGGLGNADLARSLGLAGGGGMDLGGLLNSIMPKQSNANSIATNVKMASKMANASLSDVMNYMGALTEEYGNLGSLAEISSSNPLAGLNFGGMGGGGNMDILGDLGSSIFATDAGADNDSTGGMLGLF